MQRAVRPLPVSVNGVVLIKHGQLYIFSHLYIQLMTEATLALLVMQLATARTVLASNPSRGKRLSSSSNLPDLLLALSGHIFNRSGDFPGR
jgi:hypothetical protein